MVDITNFAIEYQGIWLEISGTSAPNQCVDLANVYIRNFLKLPMIEWTNAVDFPSKAGTNYTWTTNTLTNVPEEGDLIVWNGTWGHIAIFMDGNVNDFHSLDQNYPTGTNTHLQYHNYTNVKGWLRCKNPPTSIVDCDPYWRIERDDNWNKYLVEKIQTDKLTNEITELKAQLTQKETEKQSWLQRIKDFINAL